MGKGAGGPLEGAPPRGGENAVNVDTSVWERDVSWGPGMMESARRGGGQVRAVG